MILLIILYPIVPTTYTGNNNSGLSESSSQCLLMGQIYWSISANAHRLFFFFQGKEGLLHYPTFFLMHLVLKWPHNGIVRKDNAKRIPLCGESSLYRRLSAQHMRLNLRWALKNSFRSWVHHSMESVYTMAAQNLPQIEPLQRKGVMALLFVVYAA